MAQSDRFDGDYGPSTWDWVREQADAYEASAGADANTLRDTGLPVIVMTTVGHRTGLVRKVPLMRVEHEGEYAIVGSKGGAPAHPGWYHNLVADPTVLISGRSRAVRDDGAARDRRRARGLVGTLRGSFLTLCGVPAKDRPRDPGVHHGSPKLSRQAPATPAAGAQISAASAGGRPKRHVRARRCRPTRRPDAPGRSNPGRTRRSVGDFAVAQGIGAVIGDGRLMP